VDKQDRMQHLHRLFRSHRKPIPLKILAEKLDCTPRTAQRAINAMQEQLGAPIEYFSADKGWHYNESEGSLYELPGLWLTGAELQSLALLISLIKQIGKGLVSEDLIVVEQQMTKLLAARQINRSDFDKHIKVLPLTTRHITDAKFAKLCEGVLKHQQINLIYIDYKNNKTERIVSPQTLVYYRENWYVDAWCHLRKGLRTFSVARIHRIELTKKKAQKVDNEQLKQHFFDGYGIFAGQAAHTAKLRFAPHVASEIAMQEWHPQQQARWDGNDFLLEIPYSNDKELIQDILRHTPYVTVEAPAKLKKAIKVKLQHGLELYLNKNLGWL
jgi:predicted DNA-binding transcriptional regulator YafY